MARPASKPPPDPRVDVVGVRRAYDGFFALDVVRLRHRLHDGGWSEIVERELFERGHAAGVLPYDPRRDEVVLIEQFRHGALFAPHEPWLIEIVAGIVGEGESPEGVVRRECVEEAGLTVGRTRRIGRVLTSPGGSSETCTLYVGEVDAVAAGGIHGRVDEHEDIRVLVLPAEEAIARLAEERIDNAITMIALQWLALNREALRRDWGEAEES